MRVKSRNRNEDRGARSEEIGSPFPLPPSAFPLRRAITLTEVLISMGILTLGLLGAAALFPVGGHYMMLAETSDVGSSSAQAVLNDIVARGLVNPKSWYVMVPPAAGSLPSHLLFPSDGKYVKPPITAANQTTIRGTFLRPFADTLGEALNQSVDQTLISRQFGNAYIIDPMYIGAASERLTHQHNVIAYPFPASAARGFPRTGWNYYKAAEWSTWRAANTNERVWPIRRVTFQSPIMFRPSSSSTDYSGYDANTSFADYLCRTPDDLTSDLPSRDDRPSRQNWETIPNLATPTPMSRQWTGDYSWIASVVPQTCDARNGLARNPAGFTYDVSVVVFRKRVLPAASAAQLTTSTENGQLIAAQNDRAVQAAVITSGLNGGELLLTEIPDGINQTGPPSGRAFEELKNYQWIMLCGPHPSTSPTDPKFVLKWYQVLSIEPVDGEPAKRLIVVRGPEWPWKPAPNPGYDDNQLSNNLCVGIFRGAVAAHTRSMRLESSYGDGLTLKPTP